MRDVVFHFTTPENNHCHFYFKALLKVQDRKIWKIENIYQKSFYPIRSCQLNSQAIVTQEQKSPMNLSMHSGCCKGHLSP